MGPTPVDVVVAAAAAAAVVAAVVEGNVGSSLGG